MSKFAYPSCLPSLILRVGFCFGLTMASPALAAESYFDLRVPHPFTQQGLLEEISMPLSGVDASIGIPQFLQTIDKANTQVIRQEMEALCPAKTCPKNAIAQAADDLSNFSFMGIGKHIDGVFGRKHEPRSIPVFRSVDRY
jgi:hypothetical protein